MTYLYDSKFRVTSPQGDRIINGATQYHPGIDTVGIDKHVRALRSGVVVLSSMVTDHNNRAWEFGNRVVVRDGNGVFAMYCHLGIRFVEEGQTVQEGSYIGMEGFTGFVIPSGPGGSHVHFEVRDRLGAGYVVLDAAKYMGIPNTSGWCGIDYSVDVAKRCSLGKDFVAHVDAYEYHAAAWRKIWTGLNE